METDEESEEIRLFVGDTDGPENFAGFFEDDGETGYLYVSDRKLNKVIKHLQIYNDARALSLQEQDIEVVWSADNSKCGVMIFNGMRGIIDVAKGIEGRSFMVGRSSPAITDPEWLAGF